jgi:RND family efflux transporter MFP subunit
MRRALKRILSITLILSAGFAAGAAYMRWRAPGQEASAVPNGNRKILYWQDPMHPSYRSDKPGIAPDCGMRLEPVYESDAANVPPDSVHIPAEKQQLIGVTYGTAEKASAAGVIRAVGKIAADETRISQVHSKIEGWIEEVNVDFVGKFVRRGDPLLTIYSPEMLASQQEFLLALEARETMRSSRTEGVADQMQSLVEASRRRLELWDLSGAQIDQAAASRQPVKTITLYSPATGYVTERNAFPGRKIDSNTALYTIVDLSRVWVMADIFEYEMGSIRPGQFALVKPPYLPGMAFRARVDYIQPQVDSMIRTLKARLNAENPGLHLKPDMAVDVEFQTHTGAVLSVPSEAVLDSGERKTVFVDLGGGYLQARQVETGRRIGDRIEITRGLTAGERIVTSGVFLIDSESRLKSAAAHRHAPAPEGGAKQGPAPARGTAKPAGEHKHD